MSSNDDPQELPLPSFDQTHYVDRGYYLISQFQDEKRRRDRADAVYTARNHPSYVCLMTPDNRLIHRNVFRREQLGEFLHLNNLVSTWTSPEYFVMGYPIEPKALLEGIHCFQRMGSTCNLEIEDAGAPMPSYLGCPRASISFKYMHPRAWYTLYVPTRGEPKRHVKVTSLEDAARHDLDPEAVKRVHDNVLAELNEVNREYCGCPLINLPRVREVYHERLPAELTAGEGIWRIAPDVMGEPSLQPRGKKAYYAYLAELGLDHLPCSDRPDAGRIDDEVDEEADEEVDDEETEALNAALERRREMLERYSWLTEGE